MNTCFLLRACRILLLIVVFQLTLHSSVSAEDTQMCNGKPIPFTSICIMEPFPGGVDEIPSGGIGLDAFFYYINNGVWQFVYRVGVAATVFAGVLGGLKIVLSNGDSGKIDEGKKMFISSIIGLTVLLLAGVILEFLNPIGFDNL